MDKKRFVLFLLVLLLISGCIPKFSPIQMEIAGLECYDYKPDITTPPGDVNLDGRTDFKDLEPIINHILGGKGTITKEYYEEIIPVIGIIEICAADYDKDGAVTIKDLKLLARDGFFEEKTKLMYECEGIGFSHGDLNSDGEIDVIDVVMLVNFVLEGVADGGESAICAADVNEDDQLNVLDVVNLVGIILSDGSFCGDGIVDGLNYFGFQEECDGENLNDETCESQGHDDGILSCNFCSFDYLLCEGFPDETIPELSEFDNDNFIPGSGIYFNGNIFEYTEGWNMIGFPFEVDDNNYLTLFPDAVEDTLYSYDGIFIDESELIPGVGYWLRFSQDGSSEIMGDPITELSLFLNEGWNLISGISINVSVLDINDLNGIIVPGTIYGYNGSGLYYNPGFMVPGNSYWIRALEDGEINISAVNGCTNPNVENYNPDANLDDGSCEYEGSGEIGQEGGIVNHSGASVLIPPGALSNNVIISILDVTGEISQEEYESVSTYYSFTPHGQTFEVNVTVSIPYTSESSNLNFIRLDDSDDTEWEVLEGYFELEIGTINLDGFSILAIVLEEDENLELSCQGNCYSGVGDEGCYDETNPEDSTCDCYCDYICYIYDDCCEDMAGFCVEPEEYCGDGTCNGGENSDSCSTDCEDSTGGSGEAYCIEYELTCFGDNLNICQSDSWNLLTVCDNGCLDGSCNQESDDALFDIIVSINQDTVSPGNNLDSEIILFNFGTLRPVDVELNCELQDENLTIYDSFSQTLAVEFQTTIYEEMLIPEDVLLGNYFVTCYLNFQNETIMSSALIQIVSGFETRLPSAENILVFILIIFSTLALIIIILLLIKLVKIGMIKRRLKNRNKIKRRKVKRRKKKNKKRE